MELPTAELSDLFTAGEKAALRFGQKMARNHHEVNDDDFAPLHEHYSEGEIIELCMLVAQYIGIGRMFTILDAANPVCELKAMGS